MKAVIQRVRESSVAVDGEVIGKINRGILVLLGVGHEDTKKDCTYLTEKIIHLRIFEDENGKMNRSLLDISGELLIVSQFTLMGDCRKGRRPSFTQAADPRMAEDLYLFFIDECKAKGIPTHTGQFGAMMKVMLINDGPVTFILDSQSP